jgi:predicted Rossmann-fold nucleotide-binding protein
MPIVLFGRAYWQEVVNFDALVAHGMLNAGDLGLFDFADDPGEAWQAMIRRGLKGHTPAAG